MKLSRIIDYFRYCGNGSLILIGHDCFALCIDTWMNTFNELPKLAPVICILIAKQYTKVWRRWRQRGGGDSGGRMAVVEAARRRRRRQRGVISGISAAGSAAAARQRCQRQLAGSAVAVVAGSALAARRRRAWPWQPPPPCASVCRMFSALVDREFVYCTSCGASVCQCSVHSLIESLCRYCTTSYHTLFYNIVHYVTLFYTMIHYFT